jgi:hypothetical protein
VWDHAGARLPIRAACKATPPAGKHSSVGEAAEIKGAIQDKTSARNPAAATSFDSSFFRSSRKFFFGI